jgi:formylglycine-generating enzyme required for sulfatase activity
MPPLKTLGKYEIIEKLGRGGFATVYKARDPGLNRVVALKVLHPFWSNDPGFAARFTREAQAAAGLHHPNIVSVHEAGAAEGQLYIAMAYLPGQTLRDLLAAEGALSLERALPILAQVADALDYAHEQGMVHRDVKPANIIVEERGRKVQASLLDFGLVKATEGGTVLTSQGTLLGSPEYMAPEQADPERATQVGPAADRYALGIVAYHMLTGRVPFPGNTPATLNAHEHKLVPPPRSFQPELPEPVAAVLLKMLAKAPDDRYPSACAFVEELSQAWQAGQRAAQLAPLYARLQAAVEGKNWAEALELGGQIQTINPDYRDVADLMAHARRQLQRSRGPNAPRQVPGWTWAVVGAAVVAVLLGLTYLGLGYLGAGSLPGPTATTPPTGTASALPIATPAGISTARPAPAAEASQTRLADGMAIVYVPAGTFLMGSADSDPDAQYEEKPQHQVTLDAFWIDRTEVTNAQYARCVAAGACQKSALADDARFNGADYPVVGVVWQNAADYCRWAGGRLPSEAEWEYAARGPEGRLYPWGNTFDGSKVSSTGNADGYEYTAPVGSLPAGASWVGALDMAGNVYEWTNNWYDEYSSEPQTNPSGPADGQTRVLRGGGWYDTSASVRAAYRHGYSPDDPVDAFGFRCVVAPSAAAPTGASSPSDTPTPMPPAPIPGVGATQTRSADGMTMVYVPAGTFPMGSAASDPDAQYEEKPQHQVTLDAFWIDRTEVTNAQYGRCVEAGTCQKSTLADDAAYNGAGYPVVGVAWQDAADYCRWAGGRLPSEAEWEYAARGLDGRIYPWGDTFDGAKVNATGKDDGYEYTAPVGSFPAGASWIGALDMAGNVWEWTNDWYASYPAEPQVNPGGPADGQTRALRGGSWYADPEIVRAAYRGNDALDLRNGSTGFRCAVLPDK